MKPKFIVLALGLYFLSAGISFALFKSYFSGTAKLASPITGEKLEKRRLKVDVTLPKTEECVLNGEKFTKAEKEIWEKRRPLGIMIENHTDARPQSGLTKADVVYEAVAEGGITRFLAIFYCRASAEEITVGPIRSARTYFLDWISEYGESPLYVHIGAANCNRETGSGCANGGKADAAGQIETYGWYLHNDINGFNVGLPTIWRDTERYGRPVAWEHTAFSSTDSLWEFAANKRKLTSTDTAGVKWDKKFVKWTFKDDLSEADRGESSPSFSFWQSYTDFDVKWEYDKVNNVYNRIMGGSAHKDMNDEVQIASKVVIVQLQKESRANDGYDNNVHLLYANKGSGQAYIFQDGKVVEGTWNKKDRLTRTKYLDKSGKEVTLNRGQIWIETIPVGTKVVY